MVVLLNILRQFFSSNDKQTICFIANCQSPNDFYLSALRCAVLCVTQKKLFRFRFSFCFTMSQHFACIFVMFVRYFVEINICIEMNESSKRLLVYQLEKREKTHGKQKAKKKTMKDNEMRTDELSI